MKKTILSIAVVLLSTMSYAQFQVSASGGYAMASAGMLLGTETDASGTENYYGSYGEGGNFQIRGTYFFNETFGLDLSLGYLIGADQTLAKVDIPGYNETNAIARARAFGASLAVVYQFTNNIYGRFGALIKVGGKTEAIVNQFQVLEEDNAFIQAGLPLGSYQETNYVQDFHGVFPLGFVAAMGYKYELNSNFGLFAELEYYGISLKRKDSEYQDFNSIIYLPDGSVYTTITIDDLPAKEITYYDELTFEEQADPSKELSQKVPYSSFGLNIGVTYKFKGSPKSEKVY